ncbi:MopE-related protein [Corallococcus sp. RDP092CA]|uniref:MopE-related protein n=1 Tax=Corallococcus sp. RDP092CA TaxID=3109369 RepID=UPI0035AF1164
MRLFLLAVLAGVLAGCSKGDDLKTAALRVEIHYEGFRPGCVTLTVTDQADASRYATTNVNVPSDPPPGTLSVAVFRQAGWSHGVKLLAAAKEQDCEGAQVVTDETTASLAKNGITPVSLDLSATDSDGDGFVAQDEGGTDCNDDDTSVGGARIWYFDADGDTYGSSTLGPQPASCHPPSFNSASNGKDCNDNDGQVHPGQEEFRCDGQDDNCNGEVDEAFNVGGDCKNAFACSGVSACDTTDGGVVCNSAVTPTAYYFDEDGDGQAGADGGVTCGPQPGGTVQEFSDCDESTEYVNRGRAEVCDRLDNDCNGRVDDSITCDLNWQGDPGAVNRARWNALAISQDFAWLAGVAGLDLQGNVLKLQNDGGTTWSTCTGSWSAAWVSNAGRLILAGTGGKLASKTAAQSDCTSVTVAGSGVDFTGVVGFNAAGFPPTTYAVAGNGNIFQWTPGTAPMQSAATGINLRAIHAAGGVERMFAVGAKDFDVSDPQPRVLRFNPASGLWEEETLPAGLPSIYLRGVSVVNENYVYAVGDKGVVLERNHGVWRRLPSVPSEPDLTDVQAFGQNAVYVTTATASGGTVQFFDGKNWATVYSGTRALRALDGTSPTQLGASGDQGVYQFFYRR